jgi:hypothetical protein
MTALINRALRSAAHTGFDPYNSAPVQAKRYEFMWKMAASKQA